MSMAEPKSISCKAGILLPTSSLKIKKVKINLKNYKKNVRGHEQEVVGLDIAMNNATTM